MGILDHKHVSTIGIFFGFCAMAMVLGWAFFYGHGQYVLLTRGLSSHEIENVQRGILEAAPTKENLGKISKWFRKWADEAVERERDNTEMTLIALACLFATSLWIMCLSLRLKKWSGQRKSSVQLL